MISDHPRIGLAVIGGVLITLLLLGGLILRGGGTAAPELDAVAVPASAQLPAAPEDVSRSSAGRVPLGVDPAWVARTAAAAGIPAPAMRAYGDAQLILSKEQPGCHLSWNTLAGIGWIESQHGTIGDRTLLEDGRSSTPVIGPALNGKGFAAIRSTPRSASWHGDGSWEHAVGPLQFIGSSWTRWASDGDADGREDPLDLDDAALAAGRYLCADAHDLATVSGWNAAIGSYNHDQAYVVAVLGAANTYARRTAA